jgi:hypothetical protein
MSKKFEYPIEKFIYNDEYTNEDLKILELNSHDIINTSNIENKEEEIIINSNIQINEDDKPNLTALKEELNKQKEE